MKGTIGLGPARAPLAGPMHKPAHILVVDDEAESREGIAQDLERAGYRVSTAEDAVVAGHQVVVEVPDLIVVDFKMPFMNGDDFIAALRGDATLPDIPVVFMTSEQNRAKLAGHTFGFPLLTKPVAGATLLAVVTAQLRKA